MKTKKTSKNVVEQGVTANDTCEKSSEMPKNIKQILKIKSDEY